MQHVGSHNEAGPVCKQQCELLVQCKNFLYTDKWCQAQIQPAIMNKCQVFFMEQSCTNAIFRARSDSVSNVADTAECVSLSHV